MFDHVAMVLELLFLAVIVAQGEAIRYYEKEVHHMTAERFRERAQWRLQKQKQQSKKSETATSAIAKPITSDSTPTIESAKPKGGDAALADAPNQILPSV